jgi:hypothetical protein
VNEPPPLLTDRQKVDAEHLKLLAVFHFIVAGLALLGILFLPLHYKMMRAIMDNPNLWKSQPGPPFDPKQFFAAIKWFYLFAGAVCVFSAISNLASGFFIRARRCRIFSLIIAGVDCLQFPFGTALGIFAFIVLLRASVRVAYERPAGQPYSPRP